MLQAMDNDGSEAFITPPELFFNDGGGVAAGDGDDSNLTLE